MVHDRNESVPMLYAEKGVHPAKGGTVLPPQDVGEVELSCTCVFCGPAPYMFHQTLSVHIKFLFQILSQFLPDPVKLFSISYRGILPEAFHSS